MAAMLAGLAILAWLIAFAFSAYHTAAARTYEARLARYAVKKMDFMETATKALVAENHPASWQAAGYRAEVLWRQTSLAELRGFLTQAAFLRRYSAQPNAHLLLLNTPALLPAILLMVPGGLLLLRWRRYSQSPGFKVAWRLGLVPVVPSLLGLAAGMGISQIPVDYSLGLVPRLLVVLNLLETGSWLLAAGFITHFVLQAEGSSAVQVYAQTAQPAPWWARHMRFAAITVMAMVCVPVGILIHSRVEAYHKLAGERLAAIQELATYKQAVRGPDVPLQAGRYLVGFFDLKMLFYNRRDLTRSIEEVRAETLVLRIARLNAVFLGEMQRVTRRLETLAAAAEGLAFALPYRAELEGLARRLDEMRRHGVPTLNDEHPAFAAITALEADMSGLSNRLTNDQAEFATFQSDIQRVADYEQTARLILRNYSNKPGEPTSLDAIYREATRTGPPFAGSRQKVREANTRLRQQVEQQVLILVEGYLHERNLPQARQLLADATHRLSLGLPSQQRELERLEMEARIRENISGLQGRWQMTDADSGLAKSYALNRTVSISPGPGPETVRLDVAYANTYKDGLLSKKKTLTQQWPGLTATVDGDGAKLDLPDYQFSYDERARREIRHERCLMRLVNQGRTLEIVTNGRVIYRLSKQPAQ
jgi:hypothetical protein